jgi:beta-galactosidase
MLLLNHMFSKPIKFCFSILSGLTIPSLFLVFILLFSPNIAHGYDPAFAWDANTEPDIAGYYIYYKTGVSGAPYNGQGANEGNSPIQIPLASLGDPNNPQYSIHGLSDNKTYFFVITAYDIYGNESVYSTQLSNQQSSNETNTELSSVAVSPAAATVTVVNSIPVPSDNLALGQPATASSQQTTQYVPGNAMDGDGATRWSSLFSDPQWIYVDLGAVYPINEVVLSWEAAYGKAYQIQVSTDATTWTTVYMESNGKDGTDDITFAPVDARYVRVYGTQRGTPWGYSLWEFEVYGPTNPSVLTSVDVSPAAATVTVGDTQAFTATGLDQYGAVYSTMVTWTVSGGGTIDPVTGMFTATTAGGPFKVTATSLDDNTIRATTDVTVVDSMPAPTRNLALGQPATASSLEEAQYSAQNADDGNGSSRWSSQFSDPQWIYVDLGAVYPINHVVLTWETAYGKAYQIQVSTDATTWTTVFTESNGNGGTDDITFATVNARYVRVYGTQRGTVWGYSLWEFEVYGPTAPSVFTSLAVSPPAPTGNLALGQPATASSQQTTQYVPGNAVDGDGATRWSSLFSDPQWIYVDLGAVYPINEVVLSWEAAYGKAYQIQVSTNATTWKTVFTESNGNGGTDDITFTSMDARYVRVYGTQRGTPYGYSLWEFEVYGP